MTVVFKPVYISDIMGEKLREHLNFIADSVTLTCIVFIIDVALYIDVVHLAVIIEPGIDMAEKHSSS